MGLMFGGLIFGGNFVLVSRGAYIRGAYIREFTVCPEQWISNGGGTREKRQKWKIMQYINLFTCESYLN